MTQDLRDEFDSSVDPSTVHWNPNYTRTGIQWKSVATAVMMWGESKFEILGSNHVECGYGVRREVQQFWRLVKNYKTACVREGVHMKIILPNTGFQASENCPNSFLP